MQSKNDIIDEALEKFQSIEKQLKIDLDEILDTINEIKKRLKSKKLPPSVHKEAEESLKRYMILMDSYSNFLSLNEESIKKTEALREFS